MWVCGEMGGLGNEWGAGKRKEEPKRAAPVESVRVGMERMWVAGWGGAWGGGEGPRAAQIICLRLRTKRVLTMAWPEGW